MESLANPDSPPHRICPEQTRSRGPDGARVVAFLLRLRGVDPAKSGRLAEEWLERFGIADAMNRRIRGTPRACDSGTKLAFALAHDPELVFLDSR